MDTMKLTATRLKAEQLLSKMTPEEKLGQLGQVAMLKSLHPISYYVDGVRAGRWGSRILADSEWAGNEMGQRIDIESLNAIQKVAVEESRLGIPLLHARDVIYGHGTVLPIPLGQAASWNPELVEQAYQCIAREARDMGIHWTFAPMMDICRDPRWGRVIESSGEDPILTSKLTQAVIRGFQGKDLQEPGRLLACAKHFCGYGFSEGGRDYDTTEISPHTLHNVVLAPFRAAVQESVATVMTSFNDLGGTPVSGSQKLVRQWLKGQQNFEGLVVSDWASIADLERFGVSKNSEEAALRGFNSGIDMAMTSDIYDDHLPKLLEEGRLSREQLDDSVLRILEAKFKLGLFEQPYADEEASKISWRAQEHLNFAQKLASESVVMLRNQHDLLPLSPKGIRLAVLGPYACAKRQALGSWCIDGLTEDVTSILDGIRRFAPELDILTTPSSFSDEMIAQARMADVVVLCVGESHVSNGEAKSKANLSLPPGQEDIIEAIGKTGKPLVIIQCTGRPIPSPATERYASTILQAWHGGTEMGKALAEIIFGKTSPSGKMPMTVPRCTGQIPTYYAQKPRGKALGVPQYRAYEDEDEKPLYPFGYGLSYGKFKYQNLNVQNKQIDSDEKNFASVELINVGNIAATEVAQCYIHVRGGDRTRSSKTLIDFQRQHLEAGESCILHFELSPEHWMSYDEQGQPQPLSSGEITVYIGGHSNIEHGAIFNVVERQRC